MRADLRTDDVTAFGDACEFTGVLARDRAGWLALRKTMLTASDVAPVLNLDDSAPKYRRSAISVYVEKVTESPETSVVDLSPEDFAAMMPDVRREKLRELFNDARFWGLRLEQTILQDVALYSGWGYRQGGALLRSRKYPWLGCTLDGELDRGDGLGWIVNEGKTTVITKDYDEETGDLPTHVIVQVQSQLLVTGAPLALVVAQLQGSRNVQIPIEPDREFHRIIVEEGERFLSRVRDLDPPEPDWRESSTDALARLYPGEDGSVVDLPRNAVELTREINKIKADREKLERRDREIRNLLKHKIGPATFGVLAEPVEDMAGWSWKTNKAGQRVLRQLKRSPRGARVYSLNGPAVANDPLTAELESSVDDLIAEGPAPKIRYAMPRRRSRR